MRQLELIPAVENATLEELRVAMEASPTRRGYIRLAVIRSLVMGLERKIVCELFCRSDRMVRLWITMYNEGGIDALVSKPRSGRPRKVRLQRARDLLVPILEDPKVPVNCIGQG